MRPLTTPLYTLVYITSGWHAAAGRWTNYDRQIADKCYYSSSLIEKEIRCGCAADFPCPSRPLLIDVTLLSPPASTSHSIPPFSHHPHLLSVEPHAKLAIKSTAKRVQSESLSVPPYRTRLLAATLMFLKSIIWNPQTTRQVFFGVMPPQPFLDKLHPMSKDSPTCPDSTRRGLLRVFLVQIMRSMYAPHL
jgi:hypothetical protein